MNRPIRCAFRHDFNVSHPKTGPVATMGNDRQEPRVIIVFHGTLELCCTARIRFIHRSIDGFNVSLAEGRAQPFGSDPGRALNIRRCLVSKIAVRDDVVGSPAAGRRSRRRHDHERSVPQ